MNGDSLEHLPNGRVISRFEQTPPMSTYLVAFVLTDFECITNYTVNHIRVSVCGRPEAIRQGEGDFALHVGTYVLTYFEQSYNVTYPLTKCDHFAIPDFSAGKKTKVKIECFDDCFDNDDHRCYGQLGNDYL